MSTTLLLIATGPKYWQYIDPLLSSARKYFISHVPILFTDSPYRHRAKRIDVADQGFPGTTLKRYHTFLNHKHVISEFDYAFYLDIDAVFVGPVGFEIFSGGLTATLHHNKNFTGLLEANKNSTAYVESVKYYYCGGFNGGPTREYLTMAEKIRTNIDADERNGVTAIWHDESHLNKYFEERPPGRILSSDYCYPEPELNDSCSPKIVCLDKSLRGGR